MSKTHELKIWPVYFDAIERGDKTFEVRKNDRDFQAGDTLVLREYEPAKAFSPSPDPYTGRSLPRVVTYVLHGGQWGLQGDHVVLALKVPNPEMHQPIPSNVYWDGDRAAFRTRIRRGTMGTLPDSFYQVWYPRRHEFPRYADLTIHHIVNGEAE